MQWDEINDALRTWLNIEQPDEENEDADDVDTDGILHDLAHLLDLDGRPVQIDFAEDLNWQVDTMLRVDAGGARLSHNSRGYGPTPGLRTRSLHRELNALAIHQEACSLLGLTADTETLEYAVAESFRDTHAHLVGEFSNDTSTIWKTVETFRKKPRIQRLAARMAEFLRSHHTQQESS